MKLKNRATNYYIVLYWAEFLAKEDAVKEQDC